MTMTTASKRSARIFLAVVIGLGSVATFSLIAVLAAEGRVARNPATQATNEVTKPRASQETAGEDAPYASTSGSGLIGLAETASR